MIKLSQPQIPESAIDKVSEILRSGQLVHGAECEQFEQELADYLGCKHILVVSNGTAALHLSLLALNIGIGDAVIVPDFTFTATANIVEITGAKAVIVDVEPNSYNLDPEKLRERIKNWQGPEELKAIMPVLEFGNPKHLQEYRQIADEYGLFMIEDAACALGAQENGKMAGTVGDFGCFSFHPRKTLTTGEGGAIATNNSQLYKKAALLRNHGMVRSAQGLEFKSIGLNYRLTNFQAAIGRSILPKLDDWINKRRELADLYMQKLQPLADKGLIRLPEINEGHSLQTFMIVLAQKYDRSQLIKHLYEQGIETNLGAQSMSSLGLFHHSTNKEHNFAIGTELYHYGLALPLHENMQEKDASKVCATILKHLEKSGV